MWEKIKTAFKNSVTILWARLLALAGIVLASLQALAGDPNIAGAVQQLLKPQFIPWYVIGIGIVTELCRRRTAGKES